MGDFDRNATCDYGAEDCKQYQHFGVSKIILHDMYRSGEFSNDIALLRLNRSIIFTDKLRPICLPFNRPEPGEGIGLILAGWGSAFKLNSKPNKRAVILPLWDQKNCSKEKSWDEHQLCGGKNDGGVGIGSCDGDSGGPLMDFMKGKRMVLEGIVSHGIGPCTNPYAASYFTRVRSFLKWMEFQMYID